MKCLKSSWLGTGLVFLLLANFAMAQNNDDDRKGKGKDRDRGQNSRQSDQYPQGRRQAVSPGENRGRDNKSRPAQVDYQPVEKGQKDQRTRDNDTQGNDRKERNSPQDNNGQQDNLNKKDNSNRQKDLDTRQKDVPNRQKDLDTREKGGKQPPTREVNKEPARQAPAPKLVTKQTRDGVEKVTASGQVRE